MWFLLPSFLLVSVSLLLTISRREPTLFHLIYFGLVILPFLPKNVDQSKRVFSVQTCHRDLPRPIQVSNAMFSKLIAVGILRPFDLSIASLHQDALKHKQVKALGLTDFGDGRFPYLANLEAFLNSIRKQNNLTPFGLFWLKQNIIAKLVQRLFTEHTLRTHPEILNEKIVKPIFIIGGFRTGTTFLHNMLCTDPRLRGLRMHELQDTFFSKGSGPTSPLQRGLDALMWLAPGLKAAHSVNALSYEECHHVFSRNFEGLLESEFSYYVPEFRDRMRQQEWNGGLWQILVFCVIMAAS